MIGIYKITNKVNGKVYIGQSTSVRSRWAQHKYAALHNKSDMLIHRAIRKYSISNFTFEVVEECIQEELNEKEQYWIKYYNALDKEKGYNLKIGGDSGGTYYNYENIYNEWLQGKTCKELEKIFNCDDQTITKALRAYHITDFETKSRNINKNSFVALDRNNKPLKVFYGMKSIARYFKTSETSADNLTYCVIPEHKKLFGYYWDYLTDKNIPLKELTDEEFLSYQEEYDHLTENHKQKLSINQRIVDRPTREELKKLIREVPFIQIGKIYGVSDNSIRKWCDFEKLPRTKKAINSYSDEEWELI